MSLASTHRDVPAHPRIAAGLVAIAPSAILGLALFIALLGTGGSLLGDPDTQWHIEVGRRIWEARAVPSTDQFSHTFKGAPWIAKEWLSQLALYAAHQWGGWSAVVVLAAAAIAATFAILHAWLGRVVSPIAALAATVAALLLAMPHFLARPHILVLPLIVIWMIGLISALDRKQAPPLPLAALMVLWANMHGSFPLGLVMAGVLAGEGVLDAPPGFFFVRARQWGIFIAVSLAATLVSPQGLGALLVSLKMSGNADVLRYIGEWHALSFDFKGCLGLLVLAVLLLVMAREPRTNLFRIIAMVFLAYLMIRHVRFISLFGVIAPILAARAIARCGLIARPASDASASSWRLAVVALVGLSAVGLVRAATIAPVPAPSVTPEEAYNAAVAAGVSGPVYNDYDFGGYLIAHGVETFIDGRTDQLFLGAFLPDLVAAKKAKDDTPFATLLAHYHVTWALVRTGSDEARHLAHLPGWRLIHTDPVAVVYRMG